MTVISGTGPSRSSLRRPTHVAAWYSIDCDTTYSVSICDDDGEIRCVGGSDDIDEAWAAACAEADNLGVRAELSPYEDGQVSDTYQPD